MNQRSSSSLAFALTVLVLASLACQGIGGADPSATGEDETQPEPAAGIPTPAIGSNPTEEAPAQTGGAYDGSWVGTNTVDGKEILFTVENNQIVSVALNYTGEANGCDYHGAISTGVETGGIDPIVIDGDGFTAVVKSVNDELTFAGTFTSEGEASGTLLIKSPSAGLCGEYEKEVTWTASKGSADAQPTEDTSGFVSPEDSAAIVSGFFDAVNAGDLDTAIGFADENVMFGFGSQPNQFGRGNLKAYLSSNQGVTYKISAPESLGGAIIQFEAESSDGKIYTYCQMIVQDGKIMMLSLQP